ncbi:putative ferric-chelate reductase 1 [Centropristis striata]|uniref:putative ferric-chelate reductase 1 n=1 Tax=Centropristis striata TaxID=184440 RepID=UPI0027DFC952|nr:putative ferric-chelate reductase 1 [Centropristis striata]
MPMARVVLLLVCVAPVVRCYSSGLVVDSCEDMRPHHSGQSPQTGAAPFSVTVDHSSYRPGDQVKVRLQAPGSAPFMGFLLQAREEGGGSTVGSFTVAAGSAQLLTCSRTPNSAVSHRSESLKTSIQVIWRSGTSGDMKTIQFQASFVQNYRTFWLDVRSPSVTFANDSTDASTSLSTAKTPTTEHQPAPPLSITSAGCGVTKVCFSQPPHCDPSTSAGCYFMSAMLPSPSAAAVHYEMTGPSDGYISFGFSDDQMMGNDDIYICGMGSNHVVQLQHAFSTGRASTASSSGTVGNISDVRASVEEGVISCSFTSMNSISLQKTTGFNKTYYLMFAHGPSSYGNGRNCAMMPMARVVLLLVCVAPVVRCYSSGLVVDSCEDMRPHHSGQSPQTGAAPFSVTVDHSSYRPGDQVKVRLQAPGSAPFMGFLLQAREEGGGSPVGSFTVAAGSAQLLTCSRTPNSAVSHRSESLKTSIQVIWRSETSGDMKTIQFQASFVQNYRTFWLDVRSPSVTFANDSTDASTSLSTAKTPTTEHQPAPPLSISSAGCGVTKVCFSQPAHCDPSTSAGCYFMSAMLPSPSAAAVHYEMTGPSDGYISFGFSDDQMMGNDDIYICCMGSNHVVQLQHAFSTGRAAPQLLPLGNISDVRASVEEGVISCSFTSMNSISLQKTTGFNKTYYLMFAHGPSSYGQIRLHTGTFISTDRIDMSRPQLVRKAGWPQIIKAHGALMLIAWMTMGPLGMMAARYLKGVTERKYLGGRDVWFLVHVALMSVTVATTITAFILSFSFAKAWSGGAHPVLGCLVMILSFLQPILALLRCGPKHPRRFLFNWSHALNGVAIKALAVAAIFTGLKLIDSNLNQWLMKVMGGLVGWEALFYILLDVLLKWKFNNTDTMESQMMTVAGLLMALFFLGNLTFLTALLVGIGMS